MSEPDKVSLFEMAETLDIEAQSARSIVSQWDRENPLAPMPFSAPQMQRARALEAAYLAIGLMSLEEDASRDFMRSITKSFDARLLIGMVTIQPKPRDLEDEAAA